MHIPDIAPIGGSLGWSSLVAALPLVTVFVTLGVLKWKAHWAGLSALAVAAVVAVVAYGMPVQLAALSATQGFAFGVFPIMWIVLNAIWLYELTVHSGRFADLRRVIDRVSDDLRVQAIIIAFCFGGLLEALAGFGAPVAITGVMLMAVGFRPMRAAVVVLISNTAPVAFGAIATPIITAGTLTGIPYTEIAAVVGHQTPILAAVVPLILVLIVDGRRGVRQVWPFALAVGLAFGAAQFVAANWISAELTDVIAALVGLAVGVAMLRVWQPSDTEGARMRMMEAGGEPDVDTRDDLPAGGLALDNRTDVLTTARVFMALMPYLLIICVFSVAKLVPAVKAWLASTDVKFGWPGLDGQIATTAGKVSTSTQFTFAWLSSPGSLLLLCGVAVAVAYRVSARDALGLYGATVAKLKFAILTVAAVLALAYVMNQSGQTITIGTWIAGAGTAFAFLSPILGWLGTAVTGSDTSANALFATLQQTAAHHAGLDPTLLVAANTSGGVVGKMISPQNLTIAATAVGLLGRESDIFRKVIWWSVGLLAVMCLLVGLQSTVLAWMLP
ncbi:L-lactate permease [Mycolicibacterium obuense]|uniref:L-lactate permease n=1 Tax=Mycolicibacterium obuense TaxID=1807 RepID=A0A0J6Z883_9MYCO|nr:L-lactate permease [Mycolicibacterium obuense]KKF03103.1 lactate permease [Mycolicibacterium obuense]KMO80831.1 L-lactate permease [Mycolicibacterium obuense]